MTAAPFPLAMTRRASMIERVKDWLTGVVPTRTTPVDQTIAERRLDRILFAAETARRKAVREMRQLEATARQPGRR